VERGEKAGLMSETDMRSVLEHMERLYRELYREYDEFKEADVVLQEKILTYSEEAELRGMERGMERGREARTVEMARNFLLNGVSPDIVAKSSGLPPEKVRELVG
jgi:predicted transposase/invertase (TIGR01784 family)